MLTAVQVVPYRKRQVFDATFQAFKLILLSLHGETKNFVCVKMIKVVEGNWTCVKEVLGWTIDTEDRTVALLEQKVQELNQLLAILATKQCIIRKDLEHFVGTLRSMHLTVLGLVVHLYHIQRVLEQEKEYRAWLSSKFHQELDYWKTLTAHTLARPTPLNYIVCQGPTHLWFCYASGIGAGVVWLDPSISGLSIMWRQPWLTNIIATFFSDKNPGGKLTNSTLLDVCSEENMGVL